MKKKFKAWKIFVAGLVIALVAQAAWVKISPRVFHYVLYLKSEHRAHLNESSVESNKADLLVFSYDRPLQLYAFLESVEKNVKGIQELHVLYKTSEDRFEKGYDIVKQDFPHVIFHAQSREKKDDFQEFVLTITEDSPSDFISYAVDDIIMTKPFDISECVGALKKYGAYVFMVRAGLNLDYDHPSGKRNLSYYEVTSEEMCLWTVKNGVRIWRYPNYVDFSLHNKTEILADLKSLTFFAPNTMEESWARLLYVNIYAYLPLNRTSLKPWSAMNYRRAMSFQDSKMVNIPMNLVNEERSNAHMANYSTEYLLDLFMMGYKMNTSLLEGYVNTRVHENIIPQFVLR